MHRTGCYMAPTSLISDEIREILLENNGYTVEEFHDLQPDKFIQMITDMLLRGE